MYPYLGDHQAGKTIFFPLHTFASTGASVTLTGLAVTDIEVYKGASMTQRSSDAGYALVDTDGIDLDTTTGIHGFTIDTSDNTDAGFFAAGNDYTVVVASVTVDGQTVNFIAGRFSIENRVLNLSQTPVLTGAYSAQGIADSGTAQAVSGTTLTARAASPAFGTNTEAGKVLGAFGSTQGYWQYRTVLSNTSGAGGVFTVDSAFTVTPSGTVTYILHAAAPNSGLSTGLTTLTKLDTAVELDGAVYRLTTNALEQSPASAGYIRTGSITTTGTTSSGTDSAIPETGVDKLKGKTIYWTGGGNVGGSCRITASSGTAFSVTPVQGAALTSGDTYELYHDVAQLLEDGLLNNGYVAASVDAFDGVVATGDGSIGNNIRPTGIDPG